MTTNKITNKITNTSTVPDTSVCAVPNTSTNAGLRVPKKAATKRRLVDAKLRTKEEERRLAEVQAQREQADRRRALRTHCLIEYGWGLEAVQTELMHAPLVRIFEANPLARAVWLHDAQHVEPIRIPRRVRSRTHHTLRRGKK